jgi:hypothetical protein
LVHSAIRPYVDSIAVFLVIFILTNVVPSIKPCLDAHSTHIIGIPFSMVYATILPSVCTQALDFIVMPVATIL